MTKFRFHRGGLRASMATLIEIGSIDELREFLRAKGILGNPEGEITVEPYGGPDERIGWSATWIVCLDGSPLGFSEGPIN